MDERLQEDWSGHPLEVGQVDLVGEESKGVNTALVVEVRISEKCCNEVWKGFVLGLCGRDKGGVTVALKVKRLTPSDWEKIQEPERYKNPNCILAVQSFSVHSGGRFEILG